MLDKFKTFVALAQYKSFTQAAQHLYCSQPTISQHLKLLEKHYNAQLMTRRSGEVVLTSKGEQFLTYAKEILMLNDQLTEKMQRTDESSHMSVYVSHYLANHFFDELFSFIHNDDRYSYDIQSADYATLKMHLLNEKTNFALMPYYAEDVEMNERFTVHPLFDEPFVLIVPNDHPLVQRKVIYTKDLKDENVFLPMSTFLQQRIRTAIEQKNVYPKFSHMSDFTLIQKAVNLNMGVGFVPMGAIDQSKDDFKIVEVKGLHITRQNAFIVNRFKGLTPMEQHYLENVQINIKCV